MLSTIGRKSLIAVALSCSIALIGCSGSAERQAKYLERAQQLVDKKDFDKARIEIKNALQINDNNAEARYMMAGLEERDRNWSQMYGNLSAALMTDPKMIKARVKLAQLLIASNELDKAGEELDKIQKQDPNNADAFSTRAIILVRQDKTDEAIAQAQKALQAKPGHINATAVIAGIYLDNDPAKAEQYIDAAIKINPHDTTLQIIKIKTLNKENRYDDAVAVFKQLIADNPDNFLFASQLANYYISNKKTDEAESLLRDVAAKHSDQDDAKLLLVEFLGKYRSVDIARQQLETYNQATPDDYKIRSALARLYAGTNSADKAIATYQYTIDNSKPHDADALDASNQIIAILLAEHKRPQAEERLKDVLKLEPENVEALLVHARLALADNDTNSALSDLRTVLKNTPDSPAGLTLMAMAQERVGAIDFAQENYAKLLQNNPDNLFALDGSARLLLVQNKPDEALKLLEKAHKLAPTDIDSARLLVDVYSGKQLWDQALGLCDGLLINQNTAPIGFYLTGLVQVRKQDLPKAIEAFKMSLEKQPRAIESLQMLVNALLASKQPDQATAVLEKQVASYPDEAPAQELLGTLYLQSGSLPKAQHTLETLVQRQPERLSAYRVLAAVYTRQGDPGKVEQLFSTAAQKNPANPSAQLMLAEYYQNIGKDQQALDAYNKLEPQMAQSVALKNNLAVLLIDKYPSAENLQRAQSLTADFSNSDNPMFIDTLGWLQYKMKNYPQSIALLEDAVSKNEHAPVFHYHLGMAYLKNSMPDKAKEQLTQATANPGNYVGREEAETTLRKL